MKHLFQQFGRSTVILTSIIATCILVIWAMMFRISSIERQNERLAEQLAILGLQKTQVDSINVIYSRAIHRLDVLDDSMLVQMDSLRAMGDVRTLQIAVLQQQVERNVLLMNKLSENISRHNRIVFQREPPVYIVGGDTLRPITVKGGE